MIKIYYKYQQDRKSAETQTCTGDARIFSPALYYLSYLGNGSVYSIQTLLKVNCF